MRAMSSVGGECNRRPMRVSVDGKQGAPAQAVLLWDLDNMPGPRGTLLSLASVLATRVWDGAPRIAAARRVTYRRTRCRLEEIGYEVVSGGNSASGADRRLCDRGRTLRRQGHQRFLVVSNDGYFSRLGRIGAVHVITLDLQNLSVRLAETATSITQLRFDGTGWVLQAHREAFEVEVAET